MTQFIVALAVFLLSHAVPARPAVRERLRRLLGPRTYLFLYSLVSILLLGWLIRSAAQAPFIPLWTLTLGQYWVPILVMPIAFFLLAAGAVSPNPLSVGFNSRAYDADRPGIVGLTRHPILWAFALWAFSHVVPNGDLMSLIMFGGFGLFALSAIPTIDRRKSCALGARWAELADRTSVLPFAALLSGRASWRWPKGLLPISFAGATAAYCAMLWLHPILFGPDPKLAFLSL